MALVRHCFKVNPEELDEKEFAKLLGEALWIKQFEAEIIENRMTRAIARAFGEKMD